MPTAVVIPGVLPPCCQTRLAAIVFDHPAHAVGAETVGGTSRAAPPRPPPAAGADHDLRRMRLAQRGAATRRLPLYTPSFKLEAEPLRHVVARWRESTPAGAMLSASNGGFDERRVVVHAVRRRRRSDSSSLRRRHASTSCRAA